jgi:hypothetical protein
MTSGQCRLGPKVRDFKLPNSIKNKMIEPVRTFNLTAEAAAGSRNGSRSLRDSGTEFVEAGPTGNGSMKFGLKGHCGIRRSKCHIEGSAQLRRGRCPMANSGPLAPLHGQTAKNSPPTDFLGSGLNRLHGRKSDFGRRESGLPTSDYDPAQFVNL